MYRITICNSFQSNQDRTSSAELKRNTINGQRYFFFCHSCVFARLYVVFLIEKMYCIFSSVSRPINQSFIFLFRNDDQMRYILMKQRIIFLCYGNYMVPLVFNDIPFYNIHSSEKWIIFHEISRQLFQCAFSCWERFSMIKCTKL